MPNLRRSNDTKIGAPGSPAVGGVHGNFLSCRKRAVIAAAGLPTGESVRQISDSLEKISPGESVATTSVLFRELSPATKKIALFAIPSDFDRIFINSLLASPSTGGEFTRTFNLPSCLPRIPLFDERGITLTLNSIPSDICVAKPI